MSDDKRSSFDFIVGLLAGAAIGTAVIILPIIAVCCLLEEDATESPEQQARRAELFGEVSVLTWIKDRIIKGR